MINVDKHIGIPLKRGGAAMKKKSISAFVITGLLSVLLSGCQGKEEAGGGVLEDTSKPVISMEGKHTEEENDGKAEENTGMARTETEDPNAGKQVETEMDKQISNLPYQFVRTYGIIQSEHPVYELESVIESKIPQKEKSLALTSVICQNQELIVNIVMDDYSQVRKNAAGGDAPGDSVYQTPGDEGMAASGRYQNQLWVSGDGLFLTGPGIPESGIKPQESVYASYPDYLDAYGHMRYFIEARFEIPSVSGHENALAGYALRILDFDEPLEFAMTRASEYGTLEELVSEERGSMDTHDGISIISIGEKVNEGILISWYVYSEREERQVSITYKPPYQEIDLPTISDKEGEYPIKQLPANPYWDNIGRYRLLDVQRYGRRYSCQFDVPRNEPSGSYRINIPGITFLNREESPHVTLDIPDDHETLNVDIPWKEGSVRILGITRMEPQPVSITDGKGKETVKERPAVYIDVEAVHEDKELALRGLICQRKLKWSGWEHERYDFDGNGSLSGFRIFYEDGDSSVTLKFNGPAFYWNQPFVMEVPLGK